MESVSQTPDVVIVSAYGRGHWLALELKRKNWSVSLIDVTAALGSVEPEDWEGPWGFFDVPELTPSQRARLLETDRAFPVVGGFTVWLPNGPLEMGGPLSSFQTRAFGIPENVRAYLEPVAAAAASATSAAEPAPLVESETAPLAEKIPSPASIWLASLNSGLKKPDPLKGLERLHRKVRGLPFEESWMAQLAHACASNVFTENKDALDYGGPLPLAGAYGVRHCTSETIEEGFKKLEAAGVRVTRKASVSDVRLIGKSMDAIEVKAERHGVERGRTFVWMLSSLESTQFPESVLDTLFPAGACPAEWAWTRFRFRFVDNSATRALPLAFAMIENLYLPWTHSNFAMVKRVRGKEKDSGIMADVWLRVPAHAIGEETYFAKLREELTAQLSRRLPLSQPLCEKMPIESQVEGRNTRTARYALYRPSALQKLELRRGKNFFFDGPEQWSGLDWMSQFRHQQAIFSALENLKWQWEAIERRSEAST